MLILITLTTAWSATDDPTVGAFPYAIHSNTLDNGLQVHVVPMRTPNVAAVYTWFAVGSRDEVDEGRTGFAHFFEHLAFYGTPTVSGDEREQRLLRWGAEDNAWTWLDETVYNTVLPASKVPEFLEMEADRFQHLALTPADVNREAGAVYGEFRKGQANPDSALSEAVFGAAFTVHTYGHDTIGYEADIAAMPDAYDYAMTFFDRHYRPENTTLIVTGDVDPATVLKTIQTHWGDWEQAEAPPPPIPEEPEQTEARSVTVDWATPTAPRVALAWKIPASDANNRDVIALQAVADLLFSPVGPLTQRLVREAGLAYDVWGWRMDSVDPTLFTVSLTCKTPADLDPAVAILTEEIERLKQGVDPEVLDRTRSHQRYATLTGLSTPPAVAHQVGSALRRFDGPDDIDRWWATYDALTPAEVSAAAAKYLVDEGLTQGRLVHQPAEASEAE